MRACLSSRADSFGYNPCALSRCVRVDEVCPLSCTTATFGLPETQFERVLFLCSHLWGPQSPLGPARRQSAQVLLARTLTR